jgi:hypothetical protein
MATQEINDNGAERFTRAQALSETRTNRAWNFKHGYKRYTFAELFVKVGEHYYLADEVLTCEGCGTVYFNRGDLDDEFYCIDNGCSDEHEADMDAEDRHVRLECTWSV